MLCQIALRDLHEQAERQTVVVVVPVVGGLHQPLVLVFRSPAVRLRFLAPPLLLEERIRKPAAGDDGIRIRGHGPFEVIEPARVLLLEQDLPEREVADGVVGMGGVLHTLPFLIPHYRVAIICAIVVVGFELVMLAFLRWRYFEDSFVKALASVTLGGVIIASVSAALGSAA